MCAADVDGDRVVHALHVNFVQDPMRRTGHALLEAWPTLGDVAEAVARAGAKVTVLQSAHKDMVVERNGVTFRFVAEPGPGRRNCSGYFPWRIAQRAHALRPDIIHVNGTGFPFHTRALCRLGKPLLLQDHAGMPRRRLRRRLQRWGLSKVDGVAFTALEQANPFLEAQVIGSATRIFVIPESSTRFVPGNQREARAATGMTGDPALLWVGRLNEGKDPLTLLDAVALAIPQLPGLQMWCCFHDAPLLGHVKARLAQEPELARRVHLLGAVSHEIVELLCRATDFFVLSSHHEGSGYALLEALACGAVPVVSDIPPFRALAGPIGALVPPGDAAGFAEAIVRLAARPRDQLRAQSAAHFQDNLSFAEVGHKLVAAYRTLMEARVQS